MSDFLGPHGLQHARYPCLHHLPKFAQTHVHWVEDVIHPFHHVTPFSSWPQSFPTSGSFQKSQLFIWGGQSIGASASASASTLPTNIQGQFPLALTGLISLLSKVHHYLCVPPACLLVSPISVPASLLLCFSKSSFLFSLWSLNT